MRYKRIKRGDTAVFELNIEAPYDNFDWTGATVSFALTPEDQPTDNSEALLYEQAQAVAVNTDGTATTRFSLSAALSKQLIPGKNYHAEYQLEKGSEVLTLATATLAVEQDYVI